MTEPVLLTTAQQVVLGLKNNRLKKKQNEMRESRFTYVSI